MAPGKFSDPRRPFPVQRRPLMLKDYLRDDLSSCSSNGFKSLPRRIPRSSAAQSHLITSDDRDSNVKREEGKKLLRSRSKRIAPLTIAALQRASDALIHAVRHLPFASVKSKRSIIQRSLSQKLFKRSFWRKSVKEEEEEVDIGRWKTFPVSIEGEREPSDQNRSAPTASTSAASFNNCNGNSWSDGEFTSEFLPCSSPCSNGGAEGKNVSPEEEVNGSGIASEQNVKRGWVHEEKEQFSPVSVLDFPFDDDDNCSPLSRKLAPLQGAKARPKSLRFDGNPNQLQPLDLKRVITLSELNNEESSHEALGETEEVSYLIDRKARDLLNLITVPFDGNAKFVTEIELLLDFFRDGISLGNSISEGDEFELFESERELLKRAGDWMSGENHGLAYKECWEVEDTRRACFTDMVEGGRWRKPGEEKEELGLEVEAMVFASLVNELLVDLS